MRLTRPAPGSTFGAVSSSPSKRPPADESRERTVHFISLGCPKNRVDTEVMLGVSDGCGYRLVEDPDQAEVIVVNTCGFIEAAKQESIETILGIQEIENAIDDLDDRMDDIQARIDRLLRQAVQAGTTVAGQVA